MNHLLNNNLMKLFRKTLENRGFSDKYSIIIFKWNLVVSKEYLLHTKPFRIKWNNTNQGDLYIKVSSPIIKQKLLHDTNTIIYNIKDVFLINNIKKIVLI